MADILTTIAAHTKERVERQKRILSLEALRECAPAADGKTFVNALASPGLSFICEIKKASPSKGIISEDFPYLQLAKSYSGAGADAISCLTEPKWFLGSDAIFREIRQSVDVPMLRKDFTIDAYQIHEAAAMGANAVLLIVSLLDPKTLAAFLQLAEELGLAALVETHDADEIDTAIACGARIIGVNNRNLKDFSVDFSNAARLRDRIPPTAIYVAESGVSRPEDARLLAKIGADAVLMGEVLMRADDPCLLLEQMRQAAAQG